MARLYTFGAEMNDLAAGVELTSGSGTNNTTSSTIKRSGNYSLRVNPSAAFRWFGQVVKSAVGPEQLFVRTYIYIASYPTGSSQCEIIAFWDSVSVTRPVALILSPDGFLVPTFSFPDLSGINRSAQISKKLNLNTWYCVEFASSAGSYIGGSAKLDGETFFKVNPNAPEEYLVYDDFDSVYFGAPNVAGTFDVYFDDIAINDTSGTSQTSWPGPGKVVHLLPNASGDSNQWLDTAGSAGTTNNYTLVDETPANDATDLIKSSTLNDVDMYNISQTDINNGDVIKQGDEINVVEVGCRFANDVADITTAFNVRIEKTTNGTLSESASIVPNSTVWKTNNTTTAKAYPLTTYLDPDSLPWTKEKLDTAQIGAKLTLLGVNKAMITKLWAQVDYTPSTKLSQRLRPKPFRPGLAR